LKAMKSFQSVAEFRGAAASATPSMPWGIGDTERQLLHGNQLSAALAIVLTPPGTPPDWTRP
jgi:hypothetical protein